MEYSQPHQFSASIFVFILQHLPCEAGRGREYFFPISFLHLRKNSWSWTPSSPETKKITKFSLNRQKLSLNSQKNGWMVYGMIYWWEKNVSIQFTLLDHEHYLIPDMVEPLLLEPIRGKGKLKLIGTKGNSRFQENISWWLWIHKRWIGKDA